MSEKNPKRHPDLAFLAGELLEDIELGRLPTHSLLLKTSRLARLADAREILWCLEFELAGYDPEDPMARECMRLTGRWQEGSRDEAFRAPLPHVDVLIAEMEAEIRESGASGFAETRNQRTPGIGQTSRPAQVPDLAEWQRRHRKLARLRAIKARVLTLLYQFISDIYYQEAVQFQTDSLLEMLHRDFAVHLAGISGAALRELAANLKCLEEGNEGAEEVQSFCWGMVDQWLEQAGLGYTTSEELRGDGSADASTRLNQLRRYIERNSLRPPHRNRLTRVAESLTEALSEDRSGPPNRSESVLLVLQTYLFLVELSSLRKGDSVGHTSDQQETVKREEISSQINRCRDILKAYDEILALSPDQASPYLGKGDTIMRIARLQRRMRRPRAALESLDQACALYDKALEHDSDCLEACAHKATALSSMSRILRRLGQPRQSIECCRQAQACYDLILTRAPDLTSALLGNGVSLFFEAKLLLSVKQGTDALERYTRGCAALQKAADLDPQDRTVHRLIARAHAVQAQLHRRRGDPSSAVASYRQAVSAMESAQTRMPDNPDLVAKKGELLARQAELEAQLGQKEAALFSLRKAVTAYDDLAGRSPSSAAAHAGRANVLASIGELYVRLSILPKALESLNSALASYERALELEEASAEVLNNRGSALLNLAELHSHFQRRRQAVAACQGAVRSHQQAIRRAPNWPLPNILLGNALTFLAELLAQESMDEEAYKSYREALSAYDRALSLDPESARACANKGNTLVSLADLEANLYKTERAQALYRQAVECYEKALQKSPESAEIHNNLGTAFSGQALLLGEGGDTQGAFRDFERAVRCYDAALAKTPDFDQARRNKGIALLSRGELEASLTRRAEAQSSLSSAINEFLLAQEINAQDKSVVPLLERARKILNLLGTFRQTEV